MNMFGTHRLCISSRLTEINLISSLTYFNWSLITIEERNIGQFYYLYKCDIPLMLSFSSFPSAREGCRVDPILSIIGISQFIYFLVTIDVTFAFTPHFILSHRGGWIVDQIFRSCHICLVKTDVLLCFLIE